MEATDTGQERKGGRRANPKLVQYTAGMPSDELEALDTAAAAASVSRSFALREGAKLWRKAQAKQ